MTAPWPPIDEALTEPEKAENARTWAEGERQKAEWEKITASLAVVPPASSDADPNGCDKYHDRDLWDDDPLRRLR